MAPLDAECVCPTCGRPWHIEGLLVTPEDLIFEGRPAVFTRTENDIFQLLWRRRGRLVTKEALFDHLFQLRAASDLPTLNLIGVFICRIRRALRAVGAPPLIETLWGQGWRIVANPKPLIHDGRPL